MKLKTIEASSDRFRPFSSLSTSDSVYVVVVFGLLLRSTCTCGGGGVDTTRKRALSTG